MGDQRFGALVIDYGLLTRRGQLNPLRLLILKIEPLEIVEISVLLSRSRCFFGRMQVLVRAIHDLDHLLEKGLIRDLNIHVPPLFWSLWHIFLGPKSGLLIVCHVHEFPCLGSRSPVGL